MEGSKHPVFCEYAQRIIRFKARQLAGKYGFSRDDYEDLCQELILDLLLRLPKFDPGKASLNTFIDRVVNRKVANLIRFQRQEKRDYRRLAALPRDCPFDRRKRRHMSLGGMSQDEYDLRLARRSRPALKCHDMRIDVEGVIADLPPELQSIAKLLMIHPIASVAQRLGIPRSTFWHGQLGMLKEGFRRRGMQKFL